MENIREVLEKLEAKDMHVHTIDHAAKGAYDHLNVPASVALWSTHYVMRGAEVVHVGTLDTVESFALRPE